VVRSNLEFICQSLNTIIRIWNFIRSYRHCNHQRSKF